MFGNLGPWEITLIFIIILLLFGAKKLPEFAKSLAKGIREFRRTSIGLKEEILEELEERSTKTCKSCGAIVPQDAAYCTNCGCDLYQSYKSCPRCSSLLEENYKYCPRCGSEVAAASELPMGSTTTATTETEIEEEDTSIADTSLSSPPQASEEEK